jgi:hypothetical protein
MSFGVPVVFFAPKSRKNMLEAVIAKIRAQEKKDEVEIKNPHIETTDVSGGMSQTKRG